MNTQQKHGVAPQDPRLEVVIGVFENQETARRAAAAMQGDLQFREISAGGSGTVSAEAEELRQVFFSDTHGTGSAAVASGIAKGAAIGAASGMLFVAVPAFGLAASVAGAFGGALIGGMAGIDEAQREASLPKLEDYRRMLSEGRGLVAISGNPEARAAAENRLRELAALDAFQHPPLGHAVKEPVPENAPDSR